ncbi:MAG: hypothetical protein HYZ91_04850 [Candidatus Omnitrophica bacterium]|nr:hypothetical protein [Candidatus Omnitrophota bacterium]
MPNKTPRALTICGSWVFLLGVAPLFKAAFAFLAVLPRIHELGLANSYVIASRLGFLTVFGWVFVSHSLQEVLLLSQRVNMFGIAAVAPEAVVLFVAWGSPLLLFLSPSARAYFRQPDRLKEGAI